MLRCYTCGEEVRISIGKPTYSDWLKIMHYFEHELSEGEITEATFESMVDALMTFRPEEG